jgi:hypothetical protein
MNGGIFIRVVRPMFVRGQQVDAGTVLETDAVDASMAVASGRAQFVSEDDRSNANAGVIENDARITRTTTRTKSWIRNY